MFSIPAIGFDLRRLTRPLTATLGLTFAAIGAVGVVVPLLPTTPFLLLAAWCFSNSSPRLHAWLLASPVMGQLLRDWEAHGAIRPRAKLVSSVVLVAFVAWPLGSGRVPTAAVPLVLLTVAAVLGFVWSRPSGPSSPQAADPDVAEELPRAVDRQGDGP